MRNPNPDASERKQQGGDAHSADSGVANPLLDDAVPGSTSAVPATVAPGQIWLNGDILACSCPDCSSPMSIRLWLMVADCWVCGASIELTEAQEQEALRLLEQKEAAEEAPVPEPESQEPAAEKVPPPAKPVQKKRRRFTERRPEAKKKPKRKPAGFRKKREPTVSRTGIPAALKPNRVRKHLADVHTLGEVRLWFRDVFRDLPAWLISAVVNLLILLVLAMLFIDPFREGPRELILSTHVSTADAPGDLDGGEEPEPVEFDTTGTDEPADAVVPEPLPPVDAFDKPPVDPGELLEGDLPDPPPNRGVDPGAGTGAHVLRGRDPTARAQRVLREGGTIASEAAVARGLIWLAKHQNTNGSWSLHDFDSAGNCNHRCGNAGGRSDTAGTALALLPFLGAGQTHFEGQYRAEVQAGLEWLIRNQDSSTGDLRGRGIGNMYAHGQCAIVLCEAYALTRDDWLREPAQKAIDFIVEAQHYRGGWRYSPGSAGDTSVVGWQLMALRSAQMAYLDVPDDVFDKANRFLNDVQTDDYGGLYSYQPGGSATASMTAEALLCRQYYGWPRDHKGLRFGCDELLDSHLPRKRSLNIYYVYYATQVMHHMQGDYFQEWNDTVRDTLVDMQETRGHQAGSWTPLQDRRYRDASGGRLYWTSLALCSLEVYYRHLPLYDAHAVGNE